MSEKTVVTFDCHLIVPDNKEKVFENQHIRLEAGIRCDGKLIFRNCTIEPHPNLNSSNSKRKVCEPGTIRVQDGTLKMEECEVLHPGKDFLYLAGGTVTVKNTAFHFDTPDNAEAVIAGFGEWQLEGCSFEGEALETETARGTTPTDLIAMSDNAKAVNCTFKNIAGKIHIHTITACSFTNCARIEGTKIDHSSFIDCKDIEDHSSGGIGYIRDCEFAHVDSIFSNRADIDSCRFRNIRSGPQRGSVIYLEECKITHCSFDDVELRNGGFLIDGYGDASVEYCQFTNCRTDRDDLELCLGKTEAGKIRKRQLEVHIIKEDTCTGLDEIEKLD